MCTKQVYLFSYEESRIVHIPSKDQEESYCGTYVVSFPDWIAASLAGGDMGTLTINNKKIVTIFIKTDDDIKLESLSLLREVIYLYLLDNKETIFFILCPQQILYLVSQKIGESIEGKTIRHEKNGILASNGNKVLFHVFLPPTIVYSIHYEPFSTALQTA